VIEIIDRHPALRDTRFRWMDVDRTTPLVAELRHVRGEPATDEQLAALKELAGPAYEALLPMYRAFDGLVLHMNGDDAGCHTGYSDGETDAQYIPEHFEHD